MIPLEPGPGSKLIFDLESDGLLKEMTKCHCLVIKDVASLHSYRFNDQPHPVIRDGSIEQGVRILLDCTSQGGFILGHNVIKFDVPALTKLFPWFKPNMAQVWDTLVMARLIFTDLIDIDMKLMKGNKDGKVRFPGQLFKRHSLEAWGYRLGVFKDEYQGDPNIADPEERKARKWESWNQSMDDYCVQDVEATYALYLKCLTKCEGPQFIPLKKVTHGFSHASLVLEHAVASIIAEQERHGIGFNMPAAVALYSEIVKEKLLIEESLKEVFKPRWFRDGLPTVSKATRRDQEEALGLNLKRPMFEGKGKDKKQIGHFFKTYDYTEGVEYQKVKLVEFNPGSRVHIAQWLKALHGWEPTEFTEGGEAKIDETVLGSLPYPEAKAFTNYLTITKRLGQLSEGKESWLRHETGGVIYGQMVTNGAVTGRGTHSNPNLGQVPSVKKNKMGEVLMGLFGGWGYECRALFGPTISGNVQVGIDQSGIELRCLAHYMARFDGGDYGRIVVDGDVHRANQLAAGLATREMAKTFIYAFLYGAGGAKIGSIVGQGAAAGDALKDKFLKNLPALGKLIKAVSKSAKRGYLVGLDGRLVFVRHRHAALNTLLQSAGAILAKKWMVLFHKALAEAGLSSSVSQMIWCHDELQVECPPEIADQVGRLAVATIEETGRSFNFRVPITGEYKIGNNWAECH